MQVKYRRWGIIGLIVLVIGLAGYAAGQQMALNSVVDPTACTEEAKICPDGSAVGRTGPNCSFAPCPSAPVVEELPDDVQAEEAPATEPADMVACTMDVRECPDGSFVGREAPDCAFAACPTTSETLIITNGPYLNADGTVACNMAAKVCETGELVYPFPDDCSTYEQCPVGEPTQCAEGVRECSDGNFVTRNENCELRCPEDKNSNLVVCSQEQKEQQFCTQEYAPVCGLVEVQCITTPCPPMEETFSNGCTACAQGNVQSYTAGACGVTAEF